MQSHALMLPKTAGSSIGKERSISHSRERLLMQSYALMLSVTDVSSIGTKRLTIVCRGSISATLNRE